MTFEVAAEAYDRFMGRYSVQLAPQLADCAGIHAGQRVLDVGCGPGALTGELVQRVGAEAVNAVDPSEAFVAAARDRHPGVDVQSASAEELPFADDIFDAALAQLVVHFMADPVAGLREMGRVTRPGGVVAACVWDHAGERSPLASFWHAARELDPEVHDESDLAGAREGHLGELFAAAGLASVRADDDGGEGRLLELRRLVGAVHARRRTGRRLCQDARRRDTGPAARSLPRAPRTAALHRDCSGLDCPRLGFLSDLLAVHAAVLREEVGRRRARRLPAPPGVPPARRASR